ncbi:EAL domain-containing protein [Kordiimonas lacus]|uniref:EAL domain, c-di-GMP-specific phosphodiesterase class I (Or its enzymatically inactive variant) n=1 Tax=Kordiimonas lacus TaxID=637679 RepID=A0A1G6XWJ2_9PROT|nr:EAL domain-containing protein [Kordiimonas lacus]SDD82351.1 EAL domain, c-di-GMP-specific phosphodiesterase class I (or its enzymatically inactive variant) [Kordiimonas lacus]
MAVLTQVLLLVSYMILGLAVMIIPPRLFDMPEQLAQLLGVVVFFGAWQIQNLFTVKRIEKETAARVAVLEDVTTILRGDLERTRRKTEQGDEKSIEVVGELKVLHTLLTQLTKREGELEAKGIKVAKPAKRGGKAGIIEPTDEDAMALSADHVPEKPAEQPEAKSTKAAKAEPGSDVDGEANDDGDMELDEIELTPEEAAMAVVDEGDGTEPLPQDEDGDEDEGAEPGSAVSRAAGASPKAPVRGKKAQIRLIKREDQLLSVIRSSLAENRVDLYLQPIVTLPSRRSVHYECFSRVRDEEGRIILPRQYMRVAENKGLIGTIDNLLLFRLIQLVRRLGKRRPKVRFFINMSRHSMEDEEFFPQFIDFMSANSEFRDRLVFEISQEDYYLLPGEVKERLLALGRKGFGFSMDLVKDFNKDFTYLGENKFQFIKSDLKDLMIAHPEEGDVEAIKSFLRRNGMQLVASRVESEDDVLMALESKVEYAQGYLFGEPTSAANLSSEF